MRRFYASGYRTRRMRLWASIVWVCLLVVLNPAHAEEPKAKAKPTHDFMQFVEDANGAALETAVVRMKSPSGVIVDLIGAVHIADKAYYDTLNQRFSQYDAVLYELVGGPMPKADPKAMSKRTADPRMAWIGSMQTTMRDTLKLTGQLEGINYQATNFVHADMDADQFYTAKEEKSETFLGLLAKAWKIQSKLDDDKAQETDQPGLVHLLEILCRKDSADDLKRLIGREFDSMEPLINSLEADGGTVIVGERNKVALGVMDGEIARGRKKIAIFYGAAHLRDMQTKLQARGFVRDGKTEWLKAWTLPPEVKTSGKKP